LFGANQAMKQSKATKTFFTMEISLPKPSKLSSSTSCKRKVNESFQFKKAACAWHQVARNEKKKLFKRSSQMREIAILWHYLLAMST
jgi:2-succinyl-5-enolpyruvyl-6-hydroxy-3-cyclohexene-1-carboxylate synthase